MMSDLESGKPKPLRLVVTVRDFDAVVLRTACERLQMKPNQWASKVIEKALRDQFG
jgi:hypothetical protein